MSAVITPPTRHRVIQRHSSTDLAAEITEARATWLEHGLCTLPAARDTAEAAVAQLYRWCGYPEPEFVWTTSPPAAVELITAEGLTASVSLSRDSASRRIADRISRARERVTGERPGQRFPFLGLRAARELRVAPHAAAEMTIQESLDAGIGPRAMIRTAVQNSLRTSLFDGIAATIRTKMRPLNGVVAWYGQHEAHRVAICDALWRCGVARASAFDHATVDMQATLATSTGWWWPFDDVCVLAERPIAIHTEPTPAGLHGERRLHHPDRRAVEFVDGTGVHVVHGTVVPDWVIDDPSPEKIARERNVEVRRTAIERIGWDTYIDAAGLRLVDQSPDPGNPGGALQLYSTPPEWRTNEKILLAVNGSRERDGHRRRYGLQIPGWISTAVDAAGWTYGLRGAHYAGLLRRT